MSKERAMLHTLSYFLKGRKPESAEGIELDRDQMTITRDEIMKTNKSKDKLIKEVEKLRAEIIKIEKRHKKSVVAAIKAKNKLRYAIEVQHKKVEERNDFIKELKKRLGNAVTITPENKKSSNVIVKKIGNDKEFTFCHAVRQNGHPIISVFKESKMTRI